MHPSSARSLPALTPATPRCHAMKIAMSASMCAESWTSDAKHTIAFRYAVRTAMRSDGRAGPLFKLQVPANCPLRVAMRVQGQVSARAVVQLRDAIRGHARVATLTRVA